MHLIQVMLKEYETLRQESLTAIQNRNSVLAFGLASISAVFTASIATKGTAGDELVAVMLMGLVPAVSLFVLVVWLGEHKRTRRAGTFLVGLESRINDEAGRELLSWETGGLKGKHVEYPYYAVPILLIAIGAVAFIVGTKSLSLSMCHFCMLVTAGSIVALAIVVLTLRFMHKSNRERDQASQAAMEKRNETDEAKPGQ